MAPKTSSALPPIKKGGKSEEILYPHKIRKQEKAWINYDYSHFVNKFVYLQLRVLTYIKFSILCEMHLCVWFVTLFSVNKTSIKFEKKSLFSNICDASI